MRQKRFLAYLALQALVIGTVIVLFKVIPDIKIASTLAGILFVVLPAGLGGYEIKKNGVRRTSFFVGLLQFWLFFALPILGLRVFHWDQAFNELAFMGIPGPLLHKYANGSYLVMMGLTLWNYFRKKTAPPSR